MEITLLPEIEDALRMEADSAEPLSSDAGKPKRTPMTEEEQATMLERFRLRRETLNLPGPPEGVRLRDWIHEGHKR